MSLDNASISMADDICSEKKKTMKKPSSVAAVLLAAGESKRFGGSVPKQYIKVNDKPVFLYSLEKLIHSGLFGEIVVVVVFSCFLL